MENLHQPEIQSIRKELPIGVQEMIFPVDKSIRVVVRVGSEVIGTWF